MADNDGDENGNRRPRKSAAAFRTISEVASELDIPAHVLRFWESKFAQVKPLKRGGGRRYYRPEDVELLRGIRELLYTDGYTIKGAQKLLREGGAKEIASNTEDSAAKASLDVGTTTATQPAPVTPVGGAQVDLADAQRLELTAVLAELENLRDKLKNASV